MLKRIKSITVIVCCIITCSLTLSCSSFSTPDKQVSEDLDLAFADPSLDVALSVPQDDPDTEEETPADDSNIEDEGLMEEKNEVLVQKYIEKANTLKDEMKFVEAEQQLLEALHLEPTNSEVAEMLRDLQAQLGKKDRDINEIIDLAAERYEVRKQQLKHKALDTYQKGEILMTRREYDRAIIYFENVLNQIKWSAYSVDWGTLEIDAEMKLSECRDLQSEKEAELLREKEREAFEKIREEEMAQQAQLDYQISLLLEGGIDKFMRQDFDGAEELCEQVLKLDPKNDKALEMLDNIDDARREVNATDYVAKKKEAYLKWKDEIEETRIPYYGILTEADDEEWARISRLRSSTKNLGIDELDSPEDRSLRMSLKNARADFNFEEEEIAVVANVIQNYTGIPVVVDSEVRVELEDNAQTITLVDLKDVTVESLLNIICEVIGEGLTWTIDNGVVLITRQNKLLDNIKIRIHPIKDLTFGLTDFYGPEIGRLSTSEDVSDDETNPFGGEVEKIIPIPPEDIENLIRENIARESWDEDMFSIAITQDQGSLLVIHTPEIQKEIVDFLDDMRKFSSCCVTIESRFISLNDSFIQEIGAEFRGLGNDGKAPTPNMDVTNGFEDNASTGMDNQGDGGEGSNPAAGIFFNDNSDGDLRFRNEGVFQNTLGKVLNTIGGGAFQFSLIDDTMFNMVVRAVEKSYNATEITAPIITAFNTQRSYITVINQVSFIRGFDVDVATSAFIANPNIAIIQEGIVLDVRPTVSYDRKYITLEIQTTVADLNRPMRTWSTPLAGQTTPVTFQLPVLNVSSAATTVVVPDGGSLILGGLKYVRYVSRTSETPFLGKIPILGFFFRQKGLDDEVSNLIILARANISDMNEVREKTRLSH